MSVQKEIVSKDVNFEQPKKVGCDDGIGLSEVATEPNGSNDVKSDLSDVKTVREKMSVSSSAIVKYSHLEPAVLPYSKVQKDTDLRVAPSNWLRDGRFSDVSSRKSDPVEFTSFGMAHSFPEVIGDVDLISDAENIKKLLKIPYSKAEVSLAVHRVGRTTLLDELDIPSLLLYASERDDVQLQWLYEFYCEQLNIPKDTSYLKKKKNKNQTKLRDIFSKFLHYSIQDQPSHTDTSIADVGQSSQDSDQVPTTSEDASSYSDQSQASADTIDTGVSKNRQEPGARVTRHQVIPVNEEEHINDSLPEPQQRSGFQRHVLWKFEDIHMLIGSNMPIFGGGKYPAVSLRLRECGKPINVLTGLDYWLDNLMCNVPEVAMCYHLDGIVQFYDLYKTEELPDLKGSNFSPKVVKDIAQNLLSFLKSNCTQEGHTYWLFKGSDNDVVKLYDLTSICDQRADDKYQNPFTVPVAMLFYRVAKNMMKQTALSSTDQGTVRLLLNNCLILLDQAKYPEIVTSANYLLSDLYSPDDLHTLLALSSGACEEEELSKGEECDLFGDFEQANIHSLGRIKTKEETSKSLEVRKLSTPGMFQDDSRQMVKPLRGNIEERCRTALTHIVKGLMSLRFSPAFASGEQQTTDVPVRSDHTNSPKTSPALSSRAKCRQVNENTATLGKNENCYSEDSGINHSNLNFQRKEVSDMQKTSSKAVVPKGKGETKLYSKDLTFLSVLVPVQWEGMTAALLLRKASSIYHSLAFASVSKGKYGRALRYCKMALKCFGSFKSLKEDFEGAKDPLLSSILCACGDAYLMIAKCKQNLAVHQEDYRFKSKDDKYIAEFARQNRGELYEVCALRIEFLLELDANLSKSASLYEAALEVTPEDTKVEHLVSLTRRVGNVRNELGVYYMNCGVYTMDSGDCPSAQEQDILKKSYTCFEKGIQAFQAINDEPNVALLLSNTGRLMRLCAQAVAGTSHGDSNKERGEFSTEERVYFNRAIESYQKALRYLGERKCCPEVWDTVTWELSGAFYTMATLLQDYAPLTKHAHEEVEKEVIQLMMKALKLCEQIGACHGQITQGKGTCSNVPGAQSTEQLEQRLGFIHHRLASLYHNSYRNQVGDQTKKKAKSLAELHYSKTCNYFNPEKYPCQAIRVQLERVAMCEYHINIHGGSSAAIKTLQVALDYILATEAALKTLAQGEREVDKTSDGLGNTKTAQLAHHESQELKSLLPILETRLYSVLKELVKGYSQKKGRTRLPIDHTMDVEKTKHMYSVALRASSKQDTTLEPLGKSKQLAKILQTLREIRDDVSSS